MNTVVKLGAGNFIGCTLFCGLGGNFSFRAVQRGGSGADALSKAGNRDSAATATKVLMNFMVVFLNLVSDKGPVALM